MKGDPLRGRWSVAYRISYQTAISPIKEAWSCTSALIENGANLQCNAIFTDEENCHMHHNSSVD